MPYIDGYLVPVPADRKEEYRKAAQLAAPIFKDAGALKVVECWGDDVPHGKLTDFYGAVKAEPGEIVVFSWIWWPSKAARDEGQKKFMSDPRMKDMKMPFDGKRMIFGGFEVMLES